MNKKGISEQIFIYIFVMVVIGLTLFFGIKMIKQTSDFGSQVDIKVFQKDLADAVKGLYSYSEGSSQEIIINQVPAKIKSVCIIDLTKHSSFLNIPNKDIREYSQNNLGKNTNLFLVSDDFIEPVLIKHMTSEEPFCRKITQNTFKAVIINTGEEIIIQ